MGAHGVFSVLTKGFAEPGTVPQRVLYTRAQMPAIGLGTLGSDHVAPSEVAAAAVCRKLGARTIIGIDVVGERRDLAKSLGICDIVLNAGTDNVGEVKELTHGYGVERALDCSADATARAAAVRATRKWGKIAFVGEGGSVQFNPSPDIIHDQKTIYGSWVTSTWLMEELVERLVRWNLHPADMITHRFGLEKAADACALMASGKCGKVAVCADEELALK